MLPTGLIPDSGIDHPEREPVVALGRLMLSRWMRKTAGASCARCDRGRLTVEGQLCAVLGPFVQSLRLVRQKSVVVEIVLY